MGLSQTGDGLWEFVAADVRASVSALCRVGCKATPLEVGILGHRRASPLRNIPLERCLFLFLLRDLGRLDTQLGR